MDVWILATMVWLGDLREFHTGAGFANAVVTPVEMYTTEAKCLAHMDRRPNAERKTICFHSNAIPSEWLNRKPR